MKGADIMNPNKLRLYIIIVLILVLFTSLYFINKDPEPKKVKVHQPKEILLDEK